MPTESLLLPSIAEISTDEPLYLLFLMQYRCQQRMFERQSVRRLCYENSQSRLAENRRNPRRDLFAANTAHIIISLDNEKKISKINISKRHSPKK